MSAPEADAPKRDLVSIEDLPEEVLLGLLDLSEDVERRAQAYRGALEGKILGTVFFEPSTRTRLSFEAAMTRLGGRVLTVADARSSSAAKGESLADTIRVLQAYADLLVVRHPSAGAARVAARHATIPVLNAGDGPGEHPSQTLLDLHVIRRERGLGPGRVVMVLGDLRYGRTVHSLVRGLARFRTGMLLVGEPGLELPEALEHDLARVAVVERVGLEAPGSTLPSGWPAISVRPPAAGEAPGRRDGQRPCAPGPAEVSVIYSTRVQRERLEGGDARAGGRLPVMDRRFLAAPCFSESLLLHPLPRVDELAYELDDDPRAGWFRQAAAGVPVRMALLLWSFGLAALPGPRPRGRETAGGPCPNPACITSREAASLPSLWTSDTRCAWCGERAGEG